MEVYLEDAEGNKKVLAKLKENNLFGEMAMISACERTAKVIALEDCEIAVLTREKFLALPDNSPAVVRLKNIMKERQKDKKISHRFPASLREPLILPNCNPVY